MESSTVLAFRIFVMLSCLIIVPMAAIFGSAFPDVVKSVLVDRIVSWSTGKPLESNRSTSEDGGFSAVKAGEGAHAAQGGGGHWEAPRWGTPASDAATWQSVPPGSQTSGVVPAGAALVPYGGGNQSASFAGPADSTRGATAVYPLERATTDDPYRQGVTESPAASGQFSSPAAAAQSPHDPASHAAGQTSAGPLEQPERFTAMERKLREYGAVYYLLETWGNEGELYRFHCRMAIANSPNYSRHFEATDRDALKAMSQVLARVEAWRAGRSQ